jgi:hypothetical protein
MRQWQSKVTPGCEHVIPSADHVHFAADRFLKREQTSGADY